VVASAHRAGEPEGPGGVADRAGEIAAVELHAR
jgi:hypothetical protein